MMNNDKCSRFEKRLNLLLDRRKPFANDRVLRNHCQDCEECARWFDAQVQVSDCFTQLPIAAVADANTMVRRRSRAAAFVAISASLVFALFVVSSQPVNSTGAPQQLAQIPSVVASIDDDALILNSVELVRTTETDDLDSLYAINRLATSLLIIDELLPDEISSRIEQAADPIRPLTDSVSSTLNVLRRSITVSTKRKLEDSQTSYLPLDLLATVEFS